MSLAIERAALDGAASVSAALAEHASKPADAAQATAMLTLRIDCMAMAADQFAKG